jgi:Fe2+ transport system protein FeoA
LLTTILKKSHRAFVKLSELQVGPKARITQVDGERGIVLRLMEMGLTPGASVEVKQVAPFGDPMELRVRGYRLSIRKKEAEHFEVELEPAS